MIHCADLSLFKHLAGLVVILSSRSTVPAMHVNKSDLDHLEKRYRTTFVNSLAGFRQAVLVGTRSNAGHTNLAIFNSLIHLGAQPSLFGLISRPDSVPRDTLQNILETGSYTLNYVRAEKYRAAHQTSARYGKEESEFDKAGFAPLFYEGCSAPFVSEAVVQIAMQLEEVLPIKINGTSLIIGSIAHVIIPDAMVGSDGYIDLPAEEILIAQGLDAYCTAKPIGRLPYAKP